MFALSIMPLVLVPRNRAQTVNFQFCAILRKIQRFNAACKLSRIWVRFRRTFIPSFLNSLSLPIVVFVWRPFSFLPLRRTYQNSANFQRIIFWTHLPVGGIWDLQVSNERRGFLVSNMYNLSTSKAIYAVLGPKILRFQFFSSGLRTQPTIRPPVQDYDPDTPLLSRITLFRADYLSNSIRGAADAFGVATGPQG